jgi:hypothetical protein
MDGGNKVIDLWQAREGGPATSTITPGESPYFLPEIDEDTAKRGNWRRRLALAFCIGGALAWIAVFGYTHALAWQVSSPHLDAIVSAIALGSAPLALFAAAWVAFQRSSRAEIGAFARTARALRTESERMDAVLSFVSARVDASRRDLAEQSDALANLGEGAATRLGDAAVAMRKEVETITVHTQTLKGTTAAARGDLAVLLSHLPKTQILMRQIATSLAEAGTTAQDKATALSDQMAALSTHSASASETATQVSNGLTAQLNDLITQSSTLAALAEETEARLRAAGNDSSIEMHERVLAIGSEVDRIAASFGTHDEASRTLVTRINTDLGELESRFAAFDAHGKERAGNLGEALNGLQTEAAALQETLASGEGNIEKLSERTEALLAALDSAAREIDETLPAAYGRLEATASKAMSVVREAAPALDGAVTASQSLVTQLEASEAIVSRQRADVEKLSLGAQAVLDDCRSQAESLAEAVKTATSELHGLAQGASANLIESLIRARDTARQAADHTRDAFNDVIPQTAAAFGEQSKQALHDALTVQVEAQLKEIAATTEKSVAAAQKATDRLMRQMLTISETSAALENRIAEAKDEVEKSDSGNFARRVALLIESLNSSAIDVTKILSNDVTDSAWAAYLRGDRGVFTRRAVRLLDANEAKEIARFYDEEPEFREQVNRYIHDYESMLRNIMGTRDGTPLSVALLSSDTGKLYVALAQAIERLRT